MTSAFFDTGVVLKMVLPDPLSQKVADFVGERRLVVPLTRLIELEMENTLQALRFRGSLDAGQLAAARGLVADLIREGKFRRVGLSLDAMAAESLCLSPLVTAKTGCRTLDLMQVSAAKLLGSTEFISTDARQLKAAEAAGLAARDLRE
jgi:hypothetical protein